MDDDGSAPVSRGVELDTGRESSMRRSGESGAGGRVEDEGSGCEEEDEEGDGEETG